MFLYDPTTQQKYLVGPQFVLSSFEVCQIYQTPRFRFPGEQALIATVPPQKNPKSAEGLLAIELKAGLQVRNLVPSVGSITGVANPDEVPAQTDIVLVGAGSGIKRGKVKRFDAGSKMFITTRISTVGDAGAPVVTPTGKIVGILIGSGANDESQVAALSPFLAQNTRFQLLPSDPRNFPLGGVLVQLLVSDTQKDLIPRLNPLEQRLRADGAQLPDGHALPRKRTPDDQTEVRYYHSADLATAKAIVKMLQELLHIKARQSFVDDTSAPFKMIQVSFSVRDLKRAPQSQ